MEPEEVSKPDPIELEQSLSRANVWLTVILILFLLTLGLLVYFQFYQGNGNWKFSFQHKPSSEVLLNADTASARKIQMQNDSMISIINSSPAKSDMRVPEIYFTLQIAAFTDPTNNAFSTAFSPQQWSTEGNISRLTLGVFSNYNQALQFQNLMAKKGIKGWLVKKVKGQQQEITALDKK